MHRSQCELQEQLDHVCWQYHAVLLWAVKGLQKHGTWQANCTTMHVRWDWLRVVRQQGHVLAYTAAVQYTLQTVSDQLQWNSLQGAAAAVGQV
jgi:hypothetical protein